MDQHARAAFMITQAAALNATIASMQEQNRIDRIVNRPMTYSPAEFEQQIDRFGCGHNSAIIYLSGC